MKGIGLGSVITIGNETKQYVVVGYVDHNRGDYGACTNNESYQLIPVEELENKEFILEGDISSATELRVTGSKATPELKRVENVAPFVLTKEVRYNVRRMEAKQVTVYE